MKTSRSFQIALNILLHSKLRSWLTIIGIIIGISAIVAIVSIGQGAEQTLKSNLNSMSADILTISSGMTRAMGASTSFRNPGGDFGGETRTSSNVKNLTTSDVMILKSIENAQYVMGIVSGSTSNATFLSKTSRVNIQGVDEDTWKNIVSTELASGRYLTAGDSGVIVVGGRIANSTFSGMEINRQMTINGVVFRIVGILKQSGGSDDSEIYMPVQDARNVLDKDSKSFDSIIVKIKDISISDDTTNLITQALMISHGILQTSKQDFSVSSPTAIQERISSTLSSATLFLTAIAVISLIVGAIGIMNTMFTSVLEKTHDIGILKALGAKNKDILIIFLFNAGIIGLIGGIFGIILGIIASGYISVLSGSTLSAGGPMGRMFSSSYVSLSLIIEIFILSIVVGLISGIIPAWRASRLKPVDALRYE